MILSSRHHYSSLLSMKKLGSWGFLWHGYKETFNTQCQCFSNFNLHMGHPWLLLKCKYLFSRTALRYHISNKLPGDADAPGTKTIHTLSSKNVRVFKFQCIDFKICIPICYTNISFALKKCIIVMRKKLVLDSMLWITIHSD